MSIFCNHDWAPRTGMDSGSYCTKCSTTTDRECLPGSGLTQGRLCHGDNQPSSFRSHTQTNSASGTHDFVVLASTDKFLRFGFWRPGMSALHARVWDTLHALKLRFWSDVTREIRVHPDDFAKAQAVLLNAERELSLNRC